MHRQSSLFIYLVVMLSLTGSVVNADEGPAPQTWPLAPQELRLKDVESRPQDPAGPKLVNGAIADTKDWPATFFPWQLDGPAQDGPLSRCTGTLVGPRVLLMAAHCIANGGTTHFDKGDTSYSAKCTNPSPGYPSVRSADWSLCLVDKKVPAAWYEQLSLDPSLIHKGGKLLLGGFGCTTIGGLPDGDFRIGNNYIDRLPGALVGDPNWMTTEGKANDGAFICEGDSGGAVYVEEPGLRSRTIVAVNSHRDDRGAGISFLSALSTPAARKFIDDWSKVNGEPPICGVHANAPNCHP